MKYSSVQLITRGSEKRLTLEPRMDPNSPKKTKSILCIYLGLLLALGAMVQTSHIRAAELTEDPRCKEPPNAANAFTSENIFKPPCTETKYGLTPEVFRRPAPKFVLKCAGGSCRGNNPSLDVLPSGGGEKTEQRL